jgi:hypothetical protein
VLTLNDLRVEELNELRSSVDGFSRVEGGASRPIPRLSLLGLLPGHSVVEV